MSRLSQLKPDLTQSLDFEERIAEIQTSRLQSKSKGKATPKKEPPKVHIILRKDEQGATFAWCSMNVFRAKGKRTPPMIEWAKAEKDGIDHDTLCGHCLNAIKREQAR